MDQSIFKRQLKVKIKTEMQRLSLSGFDERWVRLFQVSGANSEVHFRIRMLHLWTELWQVSQKL